MQKDAERQEHNRTQSFRKHFERIAIGALYVSAGATAIVGAIWLWHLIAPEKLRWLKVEDVFHLQGIITAGLLAGIIGNHFRKRID